MHTCSSMQLDYKLVVWFLKTEGVKSAQFSKLINTQLENLAKFLLYRLNLF